MLIRIPNVMLDKTGAINGNYGVGVTSIILEDAGDHKIKVIKHIREFTWLGLKESKDLVDLVPSVITRGIPVNKAHKFKEVLEEIGATVSLTPFLSKEYFEALESHERMHKQSIEEPEKKPVEVGDRINNDFQREDEGMDKAFGV